MPSRKFDWVYRGKEYDAVNGGAIAPVNGTYLDDELTLTTGPANATTLVLYDSQNYTQQGLGYVPASGRFKQVSRAARAEGRKPLVKAVDGLLMLRPSAWAVGNRLLMGWRILIAEQGLSTGAAVLSADFGMTNPPTTVPNTDLAMFRNDGSVLAEGFLWQAFENNNDTWVVKPRWRGKRALQAHEGLFLYAEALTGVNYINPIFIAKMRSLVSDES